MALNIKPSFSLLCEVLDVLCLTWMAFQGIPTVQTLHSSAQSVRVTSTLTEFKKQINTYKFD